MDLTATLVSVQEDIVIADDKQLLLYATGGSETYIESGDNPEIIIWAEGAERMKLDDTTGAVSGTGSAGAGKQYVELRIGGTRYKLLHDGTI